MRHIRSAILLSAAAALLAACSETATTDSPVATVPPQASLPEPPPPPPAPPPPQAIETTIIKDEAMAARFLARATFGGTKTDIQNLVGVDAADWLRAEFDKSPTLYLPEMQTLRQPDGNFPWNVATYQYWDRILTADDQLRQRMVFALSQILVISDINDAGRPLRRTYYQDVLSRNAFGNYRTMLQDVTYSPEMAEWLTYMRNRKGDPRTGRMPDENYAREILQLFTIGLVELNQDGTAKTGANGRQIETYDNDDIIGLARVFTGLSYKGPKFWDRDDDAEYRPLQMFEDQHSPLEKSFLGKTIPAGTPGDQTISEALDHIFDHPNVAPFLARQLIQRFTSSNPRPQYVERVAQAFDSGRFIAPNGQYFGTGQRGDLEATMAAILLEESLFLDDAPNNQLLTNGKIREPILRFTHWVRAFDVGNLQSYNEGKLGWTLDPVDGLGQHPFRSPSVFNFYRPGYVAPQTESGTMGLTTPEFQLVNESTAVGYLNFMTEFAFERTWQRNNDIETFVPDYSQEIALTDDSAALIDHLDILLTGGQMIDEEKAEIATIIGDMRLRTDDPEKEADDRDERAKVAVMLVLNSPAFAVVR
ncbi:MAG: DUF1800 domain-containing protein [Pseudomonadota bacterium]